MGIEQVLDDPPQFILEWADTDSREVFPSPYTVYSLLLNPPLSPDEISSPRSRHPFDFFSNPNYHDEVIFHAAKVSFFTRLNLRIYNNSGVAGKRIRLVGRVAKSDKMLVGTWDDDIPSPTTNFGQHTSESDFRSENDIELNVKEYTDFWEIDVDFGDLRPRDQAWTTNGLLIGSARPGSARLVGELRGDNLPNPQECELAIHFEVRERPMTLDDVSSYLNRQ